MWLTSGVIYLIDTTSPSLHHISPPSSVPGSELKQTGRQNGSGNYCWSRVRALLLSGYAVYGFLMEIRILGMAIASQLSRHNQITIVARNLPGDDPSIEWTSPWAGVSFIAGGCDSSSEAKMQLDAFAELWRWSFTYPDSSIRRITIEDFHDDKTEDDIWWKDFMPEVTFLMEFKWVKE